MCLCLFEGSGGVTNYTQYDYVIHDILRFGVPTGLPSRGGEDVAVYVFDINQPSVPTSFYSVLVSTSVFESLSTVFHRINSLDNSPLSHSVLSVLIMPYWSFQLYISL